MNEAIRRDEGAAQWHADNDLVTTWVGPGSGRLCSGCSRRIEFGEVECEVELPSDLRAGPLRFHCGCYAIWSGESHSS